MYSILFSTQISTVVILIARILGPFYPGKVSVLYCMKYREMNLYNPKEICGAIFGHNFAAFKGHLVQS